MNSQDSGISPDDDTRDALHYQELAICCKNCNLVLFLFKEYIMREVDFTWFKANVRSFTLHYTSHTL